jgi:hypothetical protein
MSVSNTAISSNRLTNDELEKSVWKQLWLIYGVISAGAREERKP